jgi:serine protease DegQ
LGTQPAFGPAASNISGARSLQLDFNVRASDMTKFLKMAALGLALTVGGTNANASVPLPMLEQASGAFSLASLLKQITPAVVSIAIKGGAKNAALNSLPNKGQRAQRAASARDLGRATGSGVVIDAGEGIIVTNAHVIAGADEIAIAAADGRELQAKLIGSDARTDLAVIKVQEKMPTAILIGNSDRLEVGDFVLAIGNPFLIGQTVTSGIVSALHRNKLRIEQYEDFIQTDAALYPGNSGGALVNLRGELVGINTAFVGVGNTNPGMGFAIPINVVRSVADQMMRNGEAPQHPFTGRKTISG